MVKAISLEGNIGAGKSTLLRALADSGDAAIRVEQEPVDEWCSSGMLQAFYEDQVKHGFAFQMYVLLTRLKQAERIASVSSTAGDVAGLPVIMERCLASDFEIFGKTGHALGNFDNPSWFVYKEWQQTVSASLRDRLNMVGIVYLRCDPALSMRRVHQRGRDGESGIDEGYIRRLHDVHEAWIARVQEGNDGAGSGGVGIKVLVLDASADTPSLVAAVRRFLREL